MAFILMHIDHKPIRLKEQSMFTCIAVTDSESSLSKGKYYGVNSREHIMVLNSGGIVTPEEGARIAFSYCRPTPVAIDLNINLISGALEEIFVSDDSQIVLQTKKNISPLRKDVEGFWIPVYFSDVGRKIATGWVRQQNEILEVRIVSNQSCSISSPILVTLVYADSISFYITI